MAKAMPAMLAALCTSPGPGIAGALQVGGGQVLLEQAQGLQRLGVGGLVGHDRDVGLQGVGDRVDAAEGGEGSGRSMTRSGSMMAMVGVSS